MNKAILIGRLGKDPEARQTTSGKSVTSFPVATSERYTDRDGNKQEKTEWHNVVVWGKSAENCAKYLKKGSMCGVEGKITTSSWDDKDGNKKYKTEITAMNVEFLDSRKETQQDDHPFS